MSHINDHDTFCCNLLTFQYPRNINKGSAACLGFLTKFFIVKIKSIRTYTFADEQHKKSEQQR